MAKVGMMISKNAGYNAQMILLAVFGMVDGKTHNFSKSIESFSMDRYGMKIEIIVYGVATISGRYSKHGNFNGTVVYTNGKVKNIRSANAFKNYEGMVNMFDAISQAK